MRKEKLGDRITVLHQMVSPFGKVNHPLLDLQTKQKELGKQFFLFFSMSKLIKEIFFFF